MGKKIVTIDNVTGKKSLETIIDSLENARGKDAVAYSAKAVDQIANNKANKGGDISTDFSVRKLTISDNIIPSKSGLNIGDPNNRFSSIYVDEAYLSTNTLYLGDTPIMGTDNDTIMIKSDIDQSINIKTTGVGSTKMISESNVELSTSGSNADVIVQATGQGSRAVLSANNSVEMNAPHINMTGDVNVTGPIRTKGLTIDGDLIVNGDTVTVNSQTVQTKDNIIEVNYGQVGNGVSAGQAGIKVNRGDSAPYFMVFDEKDDMFKVGMVESLQTIATQKYVLDNKYVHPSTHPATTIVQDSNHKFVTDSEKSTWNGKASAVHQHTSNDISDATSSNVADKIVKRSSSGLIEVGGINLGDNEVRQGLEGSENSMVFSANGGKVHFRPNKKDTAKELVISTTDITFNGSKMYHSGSKPTPAEIGAVDSIGSVVANNVAIFNDTNGNIKNSGFTIGKSIPNNAVFTDTNTASAVSNILSGSNNGTAITYAPYATQQAKLSFDTSTTNPNGTNRLNLNGNLYATKLYSGGTEVSVSGHGHNYDNYNSWNLKVNSESTGINIGSKTSVGIKGSGATSVSRSGNDIIINSTNTTYTAGAGLTLNGNQFVHDAGLKHVPTTESANNARFLRNDNTWQTITPGNIGALGISATAEAAKKLSTARTISLSGDVTGSVAFDGSQNVSINAVVANDSHTHDNNYYTKSQIDNSIKPKNNTLRSNLGDPSVTEMALIDAEATNKIWFHDTNLIKFEDSNNGSVWTEKSVSVDQIKKLVSGNSTASIKMNKGQYLRITIKPKSYVFLNWLYMYLSTDGDNASIMVEKKKASSENWETHVSYTNTANIWPGHMFLSHSNIPFSTDANNASHYNEVRITIKTNAKTNSSETMTLYGLEWWGGYPAGKRTIYDWDENKNVTFPANVKTSGNVYVGSNAVYHAGNKPTPSDIGAVDSTGTIVANRIAIFSDTIGNIKDSGFTIGKSVPANAVFTDTNTASATSNILAGSNNGTTVTYSPYTTQQAKLSFDTGTVNPNRTDRLNLNGNLYATQLFDNGKRVSTIDHSHSNDHVKKHTMTSVNDHSASAWKMFYSNGSGQVSEMNLGTANQLLRFNGNAAPTPVNEYELNLTTISKSLKLTTDWQNTGIEGAALASGSYMIQIAPTDNAVTSQYNEYYTGTMSWYSGSTNSTETDEIILHKAGHTPNNDHIYLRIARTSAGVLKLQIAFTKTLSSATNITFKFKRMI